MIPQLVAGTGSWLAEAGTTTESTQVFDDPHTFGSTTDMSRRLILQSNPAVEGLVRSDLLAVHALEIDRAALAGSGSGDEPAGIEGATGVGVVTYDATDGGTEWSSFVGMKTQVNVDNASARNSAYVLDAECVHRAKTTIRDTGSGLYIWDSFGRDEGGINGHRALVTNMLPNNLGVGTDEHLMLYSGAWETCPKAERTTPKTPSPGSRARSPSPGAYAEP